MGMWAARIYGPAEFAGWKIHRLQLQACDGAAKGYLLVGDSDVTHFLLSQGWAELADGVTEATYVEAVASAQSKKSGIWGEGPP
jgi:endonuclease YncB( thermonuclease family)